MFSPFSVVLGLVVYFVHLHVFKFLVPRCGVRHDSSVKLFSIRPYPNLFCKRFMLYSLLVFIYIYWCPILFPYQVLDDVRFAWQ